MSIDFSYLPPLASFLGTQQRADLTPQVPEEVSDRRQKLEDCIKRSPLPSEGKFPAQPVQLISEKDLIEQLSRLEKGRQALLVLTPSSAEQQQSISNSTAALSAANRGRYLLLETSDPYVAALADVHNPSMAALIDPSGRTYRLRNDSDFVSEALLMQVNSIFLKCLNESINDFQNVPSGIIVAQAALNLLMGVQTTLLTKVISAHMTKALWQLKSESDLYAMYRTRADRNIRAACALSTNDIPGILAKILTGIPRSPFLATLLGFSPSSFILGAYLASPFHGIPLAENKALDLSLDLSSIGLGMFFGSRWGNRYKLGKLKDFFVKGNGFNPTWERAIDDSIRESLQKMWTGKMRCSPIVQIALQLKGPAMQGFNRQKLSSGAVESDALGNVILTLPVSLAVGAYKLGSAAAGEASAWLMAGENWAPALAY